MKPLNAQAKVELGEDAGMPPRFSGKVSGILDDLSDAMSMLKDLLPSAHSELHMQAGHTPPPAFRHQVLPSSFLS